MFPAKCEKIRHDRFFLRKSFSAHCLFHVRKIFLTPVQEQSEAHKSLPLALLGIENFFLSSELPLSGLYPFRALLAPWRKYLAVHLLAVDCHSGQPGIASGFDLRWH